MMVEVAQSEVFLGRHFLFRAFSASPPTGRDLGRCPRLSHFAPLALRTMSFLMDVISN